MHDSRQSFAIFVLVAILTGALAAQPVSVTIDATRTGQPITKLMFGGFMEPATTQVWAEMLADRKFFNEINSKPAPAPTGGFGRRGPQRRWMPVGADEFVVMDSKNAYVGEWSPLIRLDAATPHGISQSGIALRAGRAYTGRVVMSGSPGAKVDVSLVWGANPGDRQTISIHTLTAHYAEVSAEVHRQSGHHRRPLRDCGDRQRHVSHRGCFHDARGQRLGFQGREHPSAEGTGNLDRALARREFRLRL